MPSRREFLKDLAGTTMGILFVNCGLAQASSSLLKAGGKAKRREVVVAGRRIKTIDFHCHCFVPEIWELVKDFKEAQSLKQFVDGPQAPKLNVNTLEFRLQQVAVRIAALVSRKVARPGRNVPVNISSSFTTILWFLRTRGYGI